MLSNLYKSLISFFLYAVIITSTFSCSKDDHPKLTDKPIGLENIVLLHVNDLHANIDAFPKISAFIKSVKDTCDNVFVLSAGDIFSGNPMVDMYDEPGYPIIDLMNHVGFDISTIGNHEFDYGQYILNQRIQQAEFPFISANIDASSATLNQPQAYHTLTSKSGFEIITLGLIETNSKVDDKYIPSTHPDKVEGCLFPYYKTEIKQYTHLKKNNNLFVVLSHLGLGADEQLANDNSEIDLIIGGHSHATVLYPKKFNNALICQAGSGGRYVGIIHLQIQDKSVIDTKAYLKNLKNYTSTDASIQEKVDAYNNNPLLNVKIGTTKHAINDKDEVGSLMTDAIKWKHDVDFAFQNSGGIRSSFEQGDILVKDVYKNDPFGNEVIIFKLSHDELFTLIKNSTPGDLKVSGMHITHQQNGYIALSDYNDILLDQNKTYKVAMNSYIASAYNFEHTDEGSPTGTTSAYALIEFIKYKKEIDYLGVKRIFFE